MRACAVVLLLSLALLGCASDAPLPSASDKGREIGARPASTEEWDAGALRAAEVLGCERVIWQLQTESFVEAVAVYARNYTRGDCLILQPHHGGADYFLGYAGQFDGRIACWETGESPCVPVFYLSDDLHSVRL